MFSEIWSNTFQIKDDATDAINFQEPGTAATNIVQAQPFNNK